ncbi:MAG: NADP-dependent phosphogluconate dehydrogenase [Phycisphaerae bacterium]
MPETEIAQVGLIGLAVMGKNLALNIADHGFNIAVFNRTTMVTQEFITENPNTPGKIIGCATLRDFVRAIKSPRVIIILIKAGAAVDAVTQQLIDAGVDKNDLVVDAGNSLWTDTIRRERQYAEKLKFFGSGTSGGELGARFGPSLMPGGDPDSWRHLQPIWEAIAAKVDPATGKPIPGAEPGKPVVGGVPCTAYIGPNGAGHYVKMVHNGIEYVDMQLISEAYFLLRQLLHLTPPEIADIFRQWNKTELDSYLIEITADILQQRDPSRPRKYLVDSILDAAGQKGTGKWTASSALDLGVPANSIAEAVFARCMSALKEQRVAAAKKLPGPKVARQKHGKKIIESIRQALYCSKIGAYAQGFQLMSEAQREYQWKLEFGTIASIWRGGCIIRAGFLQKITEAYQRDGELVNLLMDPYFRKQLQKGQEQWRTIVALAAQHGIAAPAFMSALAYYDGYRTTVLPASLIQAQRDYFGAHTYERVDQPRGKFFHLDWPDSQRPQVEA